MCPLRVLLIFLSATIAGFFLLRGLKSQPEDGGGAAEDSEDEVSLANKVKSGICSGFWTCVDMGSGRYLWRMLVSSPSSSPPSSPAMVPRDQKKQ